METSCPQLPLIGTIDDLHDSVSDATNLRAWVAANTVASMDDREVREICRSFRRNLTRVYAKCADRS